MSIWLYSLKRILAALPTLLVVSIIGFMLMRYDIRLGPLPPVLPTEIRLKNPIDPLAQLRNNPQISAAALKAETERLGLDQPMHVQYTRWLEHLFEFKGGLWQPDLGKTFTGEDVSQVIASRAGNTLLLNLSSVLLTWLIALPLGIYAALNWQSTQDRLLTLFSSVGMAFPSFVLALLLAVLAVKTGWFPLGGVTSEDFAMLSGPQKLADLAWHLALPVFVLTFGSVASLQRQMRGNLLEVLGAEYVRTARAKGLPENVVVYKHAVRTAINPMVTLMGYEFAALLGGSVLTETVLGYPGLGALMLKAVQETDTNLVMASLILSAAMLVLGNLLADILLTVVDPRIELA